MGNFNLDWYALDLFAGSGRNRSADGSEIDGSSVLALRAPAFRNGRPAKRVVSIERHRDRFAALQARTEEFGPRALPILGTHESKLVAALAQIPRTSPSFALIDPEGFDAPWTTLRELAEHRISRRGLKMELLILFPSKSVVRVMAPEHRELVNAVYGSDEWQALIEQAARPIHAAEQLDIFGAVQEVSTKGEARLSPEAAADAFVRIYAQRICDVLRYKHVKPIAVKKAGSPATTYHLVFATDNDAGRNIMNWVAQKAPTEIHGRPDSDWTLDEL
ncbi:MAG: three-Cys-motif partner protein TcmP [Solirubrobacteraceae bacterium]|nr:three-Cys-motif partner protein TcmP [Solirubrobacteraceae bacterium]